MELSTSAYEDQPLAVIRFSVIVHHGVGIPNLTTGDLRRICFGHYTRWGQVPGYSAIKIS